MDLPKPLRYLRYKLRPVLMPVWFFFQETAIWHLVYLAVRKRKSPRQIHAYSVGLPKTGTHSVALMLKCNSAHEPETQTLLHLFLRRSRGEISLKQQVKVLQSRDARLWLELESNWMLGLVIEALVSAYPGAKYVLTFRDPVTWLESEINQEFEIGKREPYTSAFKSMFGGIPHCRHDEKLKELGLYSVAGYLSYWSNQNRLILNSIPTDQLYVVPTKQITPMADSIADFVGAKGVVYDNVRSYSRPEKKLLLADLVDMDFVIDQVQTSTSETMAALIERSNGNSS